MPVWLQGVGVNEELGMKNEESGQREINEELGIKKGEFAQPHPRWKA
jgi:hypothetical protein